MQAAAQARPVSRLGAVRRGPLNHALRYLVYGPEGVGKSTLAAHAEQPIFFDVEGGSEHLDLARYPFRDGPLGHVPQSLSEVYAAIEDLRASQHDFKTLVIDTVDALEALVWAHVCDTHSSVKSGINKSGKKLSSIEDLGYGKGYVCALDEFRVLCHALDRLRLERGITVVLLGHSTIKTFKNPLGDDFDRIQLRLHDKAAGFLKEWADIVGFCAHEEGAGKLDDSDDRARPKGYSTGRRLLHLERTAAWDAKSRVPLPSSVELALGDSWAPLAEAVVRGRATSPADLRTGIAAELDRLGDAELAGRVRAAVQAAGDNAATLSRYLNDLKARPGKEQAA